jgi:hypothetical protein
MAATSKNDAKGDGSTNVITGEEIPKDEFGNPMYPTLPAHGGLPIPDAAPRLDAEGKTAEAAKAEADKRQAASDKGHVVVDQWSVGTANGGMYEVPNTKTRQTYTQDKWKQLLAQDFFNQSQMSYKIVSGA